MKRLNLIYYLLLTLLIYACNEPPEVLDKDISIAEVQEAFATIGKSAPNGRQDTIGIDWDNARYKEISLGDALVFPLENVSQKYISKEENGTLYPLESKAYAFAYKDEAGLVSLEYVQAIPTAETEGFTGIVAVSNWEEDVKYTFHYENGLLNKSVNYGREEACEEVFYFNCTDVHVDGELYSTHCEFSHSVIICHTRNAPRMLDPDDYETGGTPLSTGLCAHPFLAGEYIPCDACLGDYEKDDNGNCIRALDLMDDLISKVEEDPFALLDIDCDQIQNWLNLAQHSPGLDLMGKLIDLNNEQDGPFGDWRLQDLDNAGGTVVNLDYFSVKVNSLPINSTTGQRFTAEGFQDYFRRNINDFAKTSGFGPYCEVSSICQQETDLWNSDDPTGAIMNINIRLFNNLLGDYIGNDGVVMLTDHNSNHWNFMTLEAPYEYSHPVSGTRQFGFEQNLDGSYNFFVRGVDRFTSNAQENIAYALSLGDPFKFADGLWEGFQEKLNEFINENNGSSVINSPVTNRPDWNEIRDVLEGKKPISEIGCN